MAGTAAEFWQRVLKRTLLIFAIGLLLNAAPFVRWDAAGELVPRSWALGAPLWTSPLPWLYSTVFAGIGSDPRFGSLLFACANLMLCALLAWWLDRQRLYVRV